MREISLKHAKSMEDLVMGNKDINDIRLMMVGLQNQQEISFDVSFAAVIKSSKTTTQRPENSVL